ITAATMTTYVRYTLLPSGCFATGTITVTTGACVQVVAKAMLQGPFNTGNNKMFDNLRTAGLIPTSDPYVGLGGYFPAVNAGPTSTTTATVLAVSGDNAIVDWVFLELRSSANRNTVVATRSALIQRDGDIVDIDGVSPVTFASTNLGQYYVTVRHRNHLSVMTNATVDFATPPGLIDFSSPALAVYQPNPVTMSYPYAARKLVNAGVMAMWAGNAQLANQSSGKGVINYNGSNNDRLAILNLLGGNQLGTVNGYYLEDVNMNGSVTYNGSNNDRVVILNNLGGDQLSEILEQLLP
ncbi:MAG: hypothetical protein ABIQ93_07055, partial [Saprospiraceae bacterium]